MPQTLKPGTHPAAELDVKRSRFIAVVERVGGADEAQAVVAAQRALYPDARHHCWAYVLGDDQIERHEKSSDDGEPGGTAGIPMLQVLKARDLTWVVAVVTRYFGGVKLGAGGLVRAYSGATTLAVDEASLVAREKQLLFTLPLAHADAGRIEGELRIAGVTVLGTEYGSRAVLTLAAADPERLAATVAAVTAGAGELAQAGHMWIDV